MQLLVILLLISFILFVIFQLEVVEKKEGFDPDLPACQGSVDSYVPACYATVQQDDYLSYPANFMSDYILKTKIVTPVCPNNPYDLIGSDYNDASSNTWNINISNNGPSNGPSNAPSDPSGTPVPSNQPSLSNDASIPVPSMPSGSTDDYLLTPQKPVDPTPACKDDKKSNPDTCPPCPACERCPEPVVDCKKVVHYKDQQYPVPVIADFSQFSRF